MADLCNVTTLAQSSCCATPAEKGPLPIDNPPAQSSLRYRLGTFQSLCESMLAVIPQRLPQWKDYSQRDYGAALLEMWAMLGDILSFYQERIANEAFLRTAVLRESVMRLAALVDYRLNPGVAASAYLAFNVDKGKIVDIPKGFRVQTKPAPGAAPVPFESDEAITACASLNLIRPLSLQAQTLRFGDQDALLEGTKTNLKPGDSILIVGEERLQDARREEWELRRVNEVIPQKETDTTQISWKKPLGHQMPHVEPPAEPKLYALRARAWLFGSDAPDYNSLIFTTTQTTGDKTTTITTQPSFPNWTGKKLPEVPDMPDQIFLDTLYPAILADSWAVLVTGESVSVAGTPHRGYAEAYRVLQVDETVHANYTLNAKITRLTVDTVPIAGGKQQPENIDIFPIKGTTVLAQSEELALARVPVSTPIAGDTLTLDAVYPDLEPRRLLIIAGKEPGGAQTRNEAVLVKTVSGAQIRLQSNLKYCYDAATVAIYGNVVAASQGETIADEILGSGDASRLFQSFSLKNTPLTFVRATGPDANRWGTRAELDVSVGGVRWKVRDNLLGSGPAEQVYRLDIAPDDQTTITFGAGLTEEVQQLDGEPLAPGGARLPSGRDNVRARYRKGLGALGNVESETITTLVSTKPGLKSVTNPLVATGGADRETIAQVKTHVPAMMRAFDRAISLEDYAALARSYAGVAKARASWESKDPNDPTGRRRQEQPQILLTVATTDKNPLQPAFKQALRSFLDARRDPNQPLQIADFTPISVDVSVRIVPDPDFLPEKVLAGVAAALSAGQNPDGTLGLFAFDRLDFGLSLHLSDIYAAVQAVPGVSAALVTNFQLHPISTTAEKVEKHIFIRNTEILRCDNEPTDPERGVLKLETVGSL
jgi:predicted phage baseplate assembly protein